MSYRSKDPSPAAIRAGLSGSSGPDGVNAKSAYGGAAHLARIHGTEEDKVNCPFYFKIGACRHADRCSRLHHRPAFSPTILIKHIHRHPVREQELRAAIAASNPNTTVKPYEKLSEEEEYDKFLQFYENMYEELGKFGRIEALHVCDNLGDHMIGHVYCKFTDEEEAADALQIMNGRYYDGRKMEVEYSPVTDFREARCRDFDEDTCSRGGFCNFMHIKPVPICLIRDLEDDCEDERKSEANRRADREYEDRKRRHKRRKERKRSRRSERSSRDSGRDSDGVGDAAEDGVDKGSSSKKDKKESDGIENNNGHSSDDSDREKSRERRSKKKRRRSSSYSRSRSPSRSNSPVKSRSSRDAEDKA